MNLADFFTSMLKPWQWLVLAAVPPAIIALYFLKLRRQPLEVPSTYLWQRTIEDLHVNAIWQRLRQNLLLLLQLLLIALVILACLRPSWRGNKLTGDRFVFLIDTSASMSATDVAPTRLEAAKQRAGELIDRMKPGDVAMLVSFSDRAQVEQPFTDNRRVLRRRLASIEPTEKTSDIGEALRVAGGLANPGRSAEDPSDVAAAEALPAELFILTDGGFNDVPEFALGNLRPVYIPFGEPAASNVGIMAFSVGRNPERPGEMQAFARLENFTDQRQNAEVALYLDDVLIDAAQVDIAAAGQGGVELDMDDVPQGTFRLELQGSDDLAVDNVAYAVVNSPRRARVLLASPTNEALEIALGTDEALKIADIATVAPDGLTSKEYQEQVTSGAYDLIIYDQCVPEVMPQANTLTIGRIPPAKGWKGGEKVIGAQIIDSDRAHPLLQFVELGDVRWIAESTPLDFPAGGNVLIDSDAGPLLAIAPREGFEDAVMGFEIVGVDEQSQRVANTDWPIKTSFPLFVKNVLIYLGRSRSVESLDTVQTGQPITLRTSTPVENLRVLGPHGAATQVARSPQNTFVFGNTDQLGVYEVREGAAGNVTQRFAVNLLDRTESDIRPRPKIKTEYEEIPGRTSWETTRREAWRWLVWAAIGILLLEWYIYNRRVYI
jgi:hypothetical protein